MTKKFSFESLSKYRNVLMGLQIIFILVFHFTEDCKIYDVRYSGLISWFYNYIRSSGVDIFLLLSGFGLYFSWKRNSDLRTFYKKRLVRVLVPYLIVAVPAWIWYDIFEMEKGVRAVFVDLTFVTFFTEGQKWFWYISMIVLCYLVFPYFFRIVEQAEERTTEQMRVLFLCLMATVLTVMFELYHQDLYENINVALTRFPAFFFGILLGKTSFEKREMPVWKVWVWFVLSYLMLGFLDMKDKTIIRVYAAAFFNLCICFVLIIVLEYMSIRKSNILRQLCGLFVKITSWFGKYTLELYLVHVAIRRILKANELYTYRISYEGILIILSVIIAVIVQKIAGILQTRLIAKA